MFDYIVGNNKIEALVGPSSFNRKNNCQTVKGFQLLELYFNTKARSLVSPAWSDDGVSARNFLSEELPEKFSWFL